MNLSERKNKILKTIIESYITTGEPVGSKAIASQYYSDVSSATIRNEMSLLEEMGYLMQPHTSAGRVPTIDGYRYFVHNLLKPESLSKAEQHKIDKLLTEMKLNLTSLPERFAMAASELTGCTTINITPVLGKPISRFEIVIAGKKLVALLVVNSSGMVKTKIIMTVEEINSESTAVLTRILNTHLSSLAPETITEIKISIVENETKKYCKELLCVISAVRETIAEFCGYEVFVGGETKIFSYPEFTDIEKARKFLNLLKEEETITRLALDLPKGINIDIISNNALIPIDGMSVISAVYNMGNTTSVLCIFGPKRMNYADIQSKIGYFTNALNDIIKNMFFGNE